MKRYFSFVVIFLLLNLTGNAQFSNKGTDFWVSYPLHIDGTVSLMGIYITSDVDAKGTISVGAQTINFSVTPNAVVQKFIGGSNCTTCDASSTSVYLDQTITDGIKTGAGIHVVSDKPVVVYAHIINSARSGASLILPSTVWGKQYIVPSYTNVSNTQGNLAGYGTLTVIASEANTTVKITPSVQTATGKPAGVPFTITLANPGDVYQLLFQRQADISGTLVESQSSGGGCKSIGVFSSTSWSSFGCANATSGDNLYQQLFPVTAWGKNFLTAPAKTRTSDIIRVFITDPTTVVKKTENGTTITLSGLTQNSFYEYATGNATFIQADKPISVVQYFTTQACQPGASTGDPEMVVLNPVEQTINNITVFSAHRNWIPRNQSQVTNCYLNIIIPSNAAASFKINGAKPSTAFIAIAGTNYSYLQEDVTSVSLTNPVQNLTADSGFIAIAYGLGNVESYGYNAGTNVKDFSRQAAFSNPYGRIDSAVTCVNTPVKFSLPLGFQPTSVKWDFSAAPNINPNTIIGPTNNPIADSTPVVGGQTLYYFSPGQSYSFTNANTAVLRDTIKLYTTSASPDGCGSNEQLYTIPVKVKAKPVADFTWSHTGCVNEAVSFATPLNSGGVRWLWDLGNGSNLDITTDRLGAVYAQAGVFNVKLRSISDIGCISDEVTKPISITTKPIASFTYSTIRCLNTDITFTDASTTQSGTIAKWTWNLDDGAGAVTATTNAAKVAQYASTGTKNITLQVETNAGCKSDVFTPATAVFVNPLPQPGFILPEVCLNDASAQFTDTSKIADGSEAQFSYLWNFNAGSPAITPGPNINSSTLKNPQVKYNKSDNYTVSLRVTSKDGCVNTTSQAFTVNGSIPKADFEVQMNNVLCDKVPIVILNKSTVDFGSVTKSEVYWDRINTPTQFQTDDNPTTNKAYPHKYTVSNAAGQNYTIRMVSYSGGYTCVSEVSKTITVHPNPKAAYTISSATVCFDEPVSFTDQSASASIVAPARWEWDLGKGNTSTIQNPVRAYRDSGLFNTSLHVFSAAGCGSDTASVNFTVYPLPVLVMGTKSTAVLEGGELRLKPSFVYGNQLSYLWTPSSYLSSDTAFSPLSKPMNDIRYTFNVIAEGGCTVSDTIFVKVLKSPEIPNAFSPNGDGINDTWNIKYLESYPGATVEVYNRYGQIVFRSLGYSKPWDGRVSGSLLPIGTYYYIINPKNSKPQMTGAITIIR